MHNITQPTLNAGALPEVACRALVRMVTSQVSDSLVYL
jgi:hypothetical protein